MISWSSRAPRSRSSWRLTTSTENRRRHNDYALSPSLANALAQAHVYRDSLTTDDRATERNFGLRDSRDPRLVVVIGAASSLPDHRLRVLRELNKSLHRVEVVPYDLLGERAESALSNVERYLSVAEAETGTDEDRVADVS